MLWVIAAVGLVVARHQPRNAIGWLMLAAPVFLLLVFASQSYVRQVYRPGHHALPVLGPVALVFAQQFFAFLVVFPLIVLLFPDGRLPSARWRWVLWLYLALALSSPLRRPGSPSRSSPATPFTCCPTTSSPRCRTRPAAWPGRLTWRLLFFAGLALGWIAALSRQVISWRRSSGERRQQLKWLTERGRPRAALFLASPLSRRNSCAGGRC